MGIGIFAFLLDQVLTIPPKEAVASAAGQGLSSGMIFLLAVAAGAAVANLYYSQPLLERIAAFFKTDVTETSVVIVATQLGYAAGLLLIVPLGDAFERRRLMVICLLCTAATLSAAAFSVSLHMLIALSFLMGVACITPQLIVPYAATFADPERRGRVVGIVMGGLLIGILASRSVSGFAGAHLGWQGMYFIGAGGMVTLAIVLFKKLPQQRPQHPVSVRQLMASLWPIFRSEPVLRRHMVIGAAGFGAFSAFWTTLSFYLAERPEHYGSSVAGLFGLIGVTGALEHFK